MSAKSERTAGVSAAALAIMVSFTAVHEGEVRIPYIDSLGRGKPITVCYGSTHNVKVGHVYTHQECLDALKVEGERHAEDVQRCLPGGLPDNTAASLYDFGYNVGATAFCKSSVSKLALAGDTKTACYAMGKFVWSGGKDCRIKANKCSGIVIRRADEIALCLKGLNP